MNRREQDPQFHRAALGSRTALLAKANAVGPSSTCVWMCRLNRQRVG